MKPNNFGLFTSVLLFLIFIVLSLVFQSTDYLYIASVCPLLIVPFLPDSKSNQYIRPDKGHAVRLIKQPGSETADADLLFILFEPGYVQWNRSKLYFNLDDVKVAGSFQPDPYAASMSVLKHDLKPHPRKKNWIGISLKQLVERTYQLSYTTSEINRFVIRMADLQELLGVPGKSAKTRGQSLGA